MIKIVSGSNLWRRKKIVNDIVGDVAFPNCYRSHLDCITPEITDIYNTEDLFGSSKTLVITIDEFKDIENIKYLNPNSNNTLIILTNTKILKKHKILPDIEVVDNPEYSEDELVAEVKTLIEKKGGDIRLVDLLIKRSNGNLIYIESEIERIVASGESLSIEATNEMYDISETDIWDLIYSVFSNNKYQLLEKFWKFPSDTSTQLYILSMLQWIFIQMIWEITEFYPTGVRSNYKLKSYSIQKGLKYDKIIKLLDKLVALEAEIKSGNIDAQDGLFLLLQKLIIYDI